MRRLAPWWRCCFRRIAAGRRGYRRLMVYPRHWLERLALPYLVTGKTGATGE